MFTILNKQFEYYLKLDSYHRARFTLNLPSSMIWIFVLLDHRTHSRFFHRVRFSVSFSVELGFAIELGMLSRARFVIELRLLHFVSSSVCYQARFLLVLLCRSEERDLVLGLWREHGASECSEVKELILYEGFFWRNFYSWYLLLWEFEQRRDNKIITYAAKLQEGEHCIIWFFRCLTTVSFIKLLTSIFILNQQASF